VLEALDGGLDRALIGDGGPQPCQRTETPPAAAAAAWRLQLGATSPAERLLEPAHAPEADPAQPRARQVAPAAARRQDEIDEGGEHTSKVRRPVKASLTGRRRLRRC